MNWKLKCIASHVLSVSPGSDAIYDYLQKFVTRRWTRNVVETLSARNAYVEHLKNFSKYYGDLTKARYFEFGVARDLFSNLLNYCYEIPEQLAVDLRPLARQELINEAIRGLQTQKKHLPRVPETYIEKPIQKDLKRFLGIEYIAPGDARKVNLPSGSIDLIATTSTLEHIPPETILEILHECHRLCHTSSVMSMEIDYTDHYSHTDKNITPYNFLSFSSKQWRWIGMQHYYVNRLRHSDHLKLFQKAGFRVLWSWSQSPPNGLEMLKGIKLADEFKGYETEDLLKVRGSFVLAKELINSE